MVKSKEIEVDIDLIDEPEIMDRLDVDPEYIKELANNINENGLINAITLRRKGDRYERIAGRCRKEACKLLGLRKIRAIVLNLSDEEAAFLRASENLARRDLSPYEEGLTYVMMAEKLQLTIDKIAKKVGKGAGYIKKRMYICRMPPNLRDAVHKKQIVVGVAEELWRIDDDAKRDYFLELAIEHGLTIPVARLWVEDYAKSKRAAQSQFDMGESPGMLYMDRPAYVSCDMCHGPMKVGEETVIRACPECSKELKKILST
jgi:ParB/RepB/Spo0J family partition protein